MRGNFMSFVGAVGMSAFFAASCSMSSMHSTHGSAAMGKESAASAADLRGGLYSLLGEHVLIAAVAPSHALGGRQAAFKGEAGGVGANSINMPQESFLRHTRWCDQRTITCT